jgi:hypothetical protein
LTIRENDPFKTPNAPISDIGAEHSIPYSKIAGRCGFIFTIPVFALIFTQMVIINNQLNQNSLSNRTALGLIAFASGQVGMLVVVYFTPFLLAWKRVINLRSIIIASLFSASSSTVLFAFGWSIFYAVKIHRLFVPQFHVDLSLAIIWCVSSLYAFLELVVYSWRVKKYAQSA